MSRDLRDVLHSAAPTTRTGPDLDAIERRARVRQRRRRAVLTTATVVLLAGVVVTAVQLVQSDVSPPLIDEPRPPIIDPDPAESDPAGPEFATMGFDPGPLAPRGGHSNVWTGTEMIVWGGWGDDMGQLRFDDGAAFDPAANTWRMLAASLVTPRRDHVAVWTGTEMLIVGGDHMQVQGAAYDPAGDRWRALPDAPFPVRAVSPGQPSQVGWAWTGEQLVVWGVGSDRVAGYTPSTDTWLDLPSVGLDADHGVLRWSGQALYAVATRSGPSQASNGQGGLQVARLDADGGSWVPLPEVDLSTAGYTIPASPELTAWADGRLIAWTDHGDVGRTVALDPATERWEDITSTPLDGCEVRPEPLVLEDRVLAFGWCGDDALYDPATDMWHPIPLTASGQARHVVWTGQEILSWGDTCCYGTGTSEPFTIRAWRYSALVPIPDLQGLPLGDAQARLASIGLRGAPHAGESWSDPDDPDAVVVHQEPPAGTLVEPDDVVGFRTAQVSPELCAIMTRIPPRQGDATDQANTDGFWDMLADAHGHAASVLRAAIDELVQAQPTPPSQLPPGPLDIVTIHHDACHLG